MISVVFYVLLLFGVIGVGYYIYKKLRKKRIIKKDYNRNFSKSDLGVRKDLEVLRKELHKSENPELSNEILNKIEVLVNSRNTNKK